MNHKSGTQDFQTWGRAPSSGSHRKMWSTKSEKQAEKYRVPFVILVLQTRNVNVFPQKPVCNCSFIYNHQNQETLQCPSSGQWINYHTCGYTTPWMNLSNKLIMLSERNQTEKLLTIGFHLSDILETAECRDKKQQWLSGTEVWGGDWLWRGTCGVKGLFRINYGGSVWWQLHHRIPFLQVLESKKGKIYYKQTIYLPHKPEWIVTATTNVTPAMRPPWPRFFMALFPTYPVQVLLPTPLLLYKALHRVSRNCSVISGLLSF